MFNFIKNIFKKEKKVDNLTSEKVFGDDFTNNKRNRKGSCEDCKLQPICKEQNKYDFRCDYAPEINHFDKDKDSILIIDDNEGIISFLEDDIEELHQEGVINKDKYNILSFASNLAAFQFEVTQRKAKGLNIKYAIIDITFGGSIMTEEGNIRYNGVDVAEMILEYNKDAKIVFFTGNNLNPYIKENKAMIEKFKELTGKNIADHIIYKTSNEMEERRNAFKRLLFDRRKREEK